MLQLLKNKSFQKFGFRLLVVTVIFFGVKLTISHSQEGSLFDPEPIFYFLSAFFLTLFTWEIHDRQVKKQMKKPGGLDLQRSLNSIGVTFFMMAPVSALIYYLGIYQLEVCSVIDENRPLQFRIDWIRSLLLGISIMVFNLLYFSTKQKKRMEHKMNELQKEVMTSKYRSLKNQISPHFLFNSLNTLTSLMYEDRDLASDFVTRLASSYRYILDNKEEDVATLEKELGFLDSFIFMMNVRHKDAISIRTDIGVDTAKYSIPTLSLQMLVENAMKHNFFSKEKPMEIKVYTVGKIALVVENTLRKRDLKKESTQLGIKNIQKRYAFYTNQEMAIESDAECFRVTLPLLSVTALGHPVKLIS